MDMWFGNQERGMGWRCYGSPHLGHTLLETIKVDEAGQEMVLNKTSPRKASKEYLKDRSRINFSEDTWRSQRDGKRTRRLWTKRRKFEKGQRDGRC